MFASYVVDMRQIEWFPELFTACGMLQSVFTDRKFTGAVLCGGYVLQIAVGRMAKRIAWQKICLNCYFRFSRKQHNLDV